MFTKNSTKYLLLSFVGFSLNDPIAIIIAAKVVFE